MLCSGWASPRYGYTKRVPLLQSPGNGFGKSTAKNEYDRRGADSCPGWRGLLLPVLSKHGGTVYTSRAQTAVHGIPYFVQCGTGAVITDALGDKGMVPRLWGCMRPRPTQNICGYNRIPLTCSGESVVAPPRRHTGPGESVPRLRVSRHAPTSRVRSCGE